MYKSVYLLITILVFRASFANGLKSEQLHIGGIFPIMGKGGWQGGQGKLADVAQRFISSNIEGKHSVELYKVPCLLFLS